jgi:hypothetical protein
MGGGGWLVSFRTLYSDKHRFGKGDLRKKLKTYFNRFSIPPNKNKNLSSIEKKMDIRVYPANQRQVKETQTKNTGLTRNLSYYREACRDSG